MQGSPLQSNELIAEFRVSCPRTWMRAPVDSEIKAGSVVALRVIYTLLWQFQNSQNKVLILEMYKLIQKNLKLPK